MPHAALVRARVERRRLGGRDLLVRERLRELRRVLVDRRRRRVRGLGQDADLVVEGRGAAQAAVPPLVVLLAGHRADLALAVQALGHRVAEEVDPARDLSRDVRVHRVLERRQEDARRIGRGLVRVVDQLRIPRVPQHVAEIARLGQVEHEPVAVVVVPGVLLVELGIARVLELRPDVLHVPVGDVLAAVRVDVRDEQRDDVLEDRLRLGRVGRQQVVGELRRGLRRPDLGRVDAEVDPGDRLALLGQGRAPGRR